MKKRNWFRMSEYAVAYGLCLTFAVLAWKVVLVDYRVAAVEMAAEPWRWKALAFTVLLYAAWLSPTACWYKSRAEDAEGGEEEDDEEQA